jgi:hypothetical protein
MSFSTEAYVSRLLELNKDHLPATAKTTASFYWGLLAEVMEVEACIGNDAMLLEVGDTVAYFTLCLYASGYSLDIASLIETAWEFPQAADLSELIESYASNIQRYYRENAPVKYSFMRCFLAHVFCLLQLEPPFEVDGNPVNYELADVLEANLRKLEDRAARGLLTKGKGSYR